MPKTGVSIVGAGNWGISLWRACIERGIAVREVVVRQNSSRGSRAFIVPFEKAIFDARILWLCVRDGEISEVAQQIAVRRPNLSGQIVIHSSGALNVERLAAASRAGADTGSIAPVMSFPTRKAVPLKDVLFAVEATGGVQRELFRLVRKLGGRPFALASAKKPLYHAAATMASPLLVSELSAVMETALLAGLPPKQARQWVESLVTATVRNFFTNGPEKAFSGSFARGDDATILLHRQVLAGHPILADVYRSLALQAVARLPVKNGQKLAGVLKNTAKESKSRVRH